MSAQAGHPAFLDGFKAGALDGSREDPAADVAVVVPAPRVA